MPEKRTKARAQRDLKQGKSASTAAGEFVREEIHHIRAGKHGARSPEQAIAIGLSKARRAGVKLGASKSASPATRKQATRDTARARTHKAVSPARSHATTKALQREGHAAASKGALAAHARRAARTRKAVGP